MNLLHALRHTRHGLTAAQLLEQVEGYQGVGPSQRRKLERDKDTLRELGIVIRTEPDAAVHEGVEVRYRVEEADYTLPPVRLGPEQAQVLALAAQAWKEGSLPAAARRAVTKLLAVAEAPSHQEAAVSLTAAASLPPALVDAVAERCLVSFEYSSLSSQSVSTRQVEPHRLRLRAGAWYLEAVEPATGRSLTFRVERITGEVRLTSAPGAFTRARGGGQGPSTARLALLPGKGLALRARARPGDALPEAGTAQVPPGRDLVEVSYDDPAAFAGLLAAMGADVLVLSPPRLRSLVLSHLEAVARLEPGQEHEPEAEED